MRLPWLGMWVDEPSSTAVHVLAEGLGRDASEVGTALGRHWCHVHEGYADEAFSYVAAGMPVQAVLGVAGKRLVVVDPNGAVFGSLQDVSAHEPVFVARSRATPTGLARLVEATARRRRRRFRWCDSCWRITPPEDRIGVLCTPCYSATNGIDF